MIEPAHRPPRACVNSNGSQKRTYYKREEARKAAKVGGQHGLGRLSAYKCGQCTGYHVGSKRK